MNYKNIDNVLNIGQDIIKKHVKSGYKVLDCTVGNGHDTLLLSKLVGNRGIVYGFDIQKEAIKNTKQLLRSENQETNVKLFLDSHENIDKYINGNINFIVYNLGYLPGSNKKIRTKPNTSLKSIQKSLYLLKENALLLITVYPGHTGGREEKDKIENFLSNLDQIYYNVLKYEFINQINDPPILYHIERSNKDMEV